MSLLLGAILCALGVTVWIFALTFALGDDLGRPAPPSPEMPSCQRVVALHRWVFLGHPRCRRLFWLGWVGWFCGSCLMIAALITAT
jgi:hypothetical protein